MTEQLPNADVVPLPERLSAQSEDVGLRARLIVSSEAALNPDNHALPPISIDQLVNPNARDHTYQLLEVASHREREAQWSGDIRDAAAKKQEWANQITGLFQQHKDFFTKTDTGHRWSILFKDLGLHTDVPHQDEANAFFDTYLKGGHEKQNTKAFVKKLTTLYTENGHLRMEDLRRDRDAIEWLAHTFGGISAEAISEMVLAEAEVQHNPLQMASKANEQVNGTTRSNVLTPRADRILRHLTGKAVSARIEPHHAPPAEPPPHEPPPHEPAPHERVPGSLAGHEAKPGAPAAHPRSSRPEAAKPHAEPAQEIKITHLFPLAHEQLPMAELASVQEILARPLTSENSAAVAVLANQISREANHFLATTNDPTQLAMFIAAQFNRVGLYQRVVEQESFGPENFERAERIEDADTNFAKVAADVQTIIKSSAQDKYTLIPDGNWLHFQSPDYNQSTYKRSSRLYLNPNYSHYEEVIKALQQYGKDKPLMWKIIAPSRSSDLLRLDKVVIYLSEQNEQDIVDMMMKFDEAAFSGKTVPGGSLFGLRDGVGLAPQSFIVGKDGHKKTGGEINEERIRKQMEAVEVKTFRELPFSFASEAEWKSSAEYAIYKKFATVNGGAAWPAGYDDPTIKEIWAETLLDTGYQTGFTYQQDVMNTHMIKPDSTVLKGAVAQNLRSRGYTAQADQIESSSLKDFETKFYLTVSIGSDQIKKIGFALEMLKLLKTNSNPGDFFRNHNIT